MKLSDQFFHEGMAEAAQVNWFDEKLQVICAYLV